VFETKSLKKPGDKKGTARRRNKKKGKKKVDDTLFKQPKKSTVKCTAARPQKFSASDACQEQSFMRPNKKKVEKKVDDTLFKQPKKSTVIKKKVDDTLFKQPKKSTVIEKKVDDTLFKQPKKSTVKCTAARPQKFSALGGSDARQEQALVNCMQIIEKDISWKEGQRNDVVRALKKQRQQMLKRWEDQPSHNSRGSR